MLEVHDLHAYLRQEPHPAGCRSHGRRGRDRQPARPQRRRPLDHLQGDHGAGAAAGQITFRGQAIAGLRPDQIAHAGIGYVPEDRQIFPTLTVQQNLELGLKRAGAFGRWNFDDMFGLFPNLAARRDEPAGVLSGGEQQMLTMCRTLMGDPELIIIDEPTEGLAPKLVEQVALCSTKSPAAAWRSCWSSRS